VPGRLGGKAAVVTGAASGIGRAVMLLFAAEGCRVVGLDRDRAAGEALAREIADAGGSAVFHPGDVRHEEDLRSAIATCAERFGRLDVLHNNAGVEVEGAIHETSDADWDYVNDVNLKAVFWGCKHAVAAMLADGKGGVIVNTASIASFVGDPLLPAYTATKAGVLGLTRSIGVRHAADGIRCNCVCPGDVDTPLLAQYFAAGGDADAARTAVERAYPGGRIALPEEIASAVLFLACHESSFVNGTAIVVDGGLTAKPY
jgi:NAD(P)-dependent dehydrogenase (short-subunit alcohol dehydrogenase family)